MRCLYPLNGWKSRIRSCSGKRGVVFDVSAGYVDMPVTVPCGRCILCRLETSRQWAMRCMHEASLHEENCFVTLTYRDEMLPEDGSLVKRDFQKFMKRLRARNDGRRIRFYHVGEYGERSRRPHYHCLLFGFDFVDKVHWTYRNGNEVWISKELEEVWPLGFSEIGSVTFESAAYCARYIVDKFKHKDAELVKAHYGGREPEYSTMSRRPGIGREWFEKFRCEVYANDSVIVRGREVRPPKYYDGLYVICEPDKMARVKRKRLLKSSDDEERGSKALCALKNTEARLNLRVKGIV